jgi:hypothetical protein
VTGAGLQRLPQLQVSLGRRNIAAKMWGAAGPGQGPTAAGCSPSRQMRGGAPTAGLAKMRQGALRWRGPSREGALRWQRVALPAGRAAWIQTALQIRQPDGLSGVVAMAPAMFLSRSEKDLSRPHAAPSAGKTHQSIRFIQTRARLPGCGQPPGRRP